MNKQTKSQILYSILGVAFILMLWLLFYLVVRNDYILPAPFTVLEKGFGLLFNKEFYLSLSTTIARVFLSVAISLIVATGLSLLALLFEKFGNFITPLLATMRSLPTLAVLLIILVFTKRSFAPIVIAVLSLIPLFYTAIYGEASKTKNLASDVFKVYEVSKKAQVKVYLKGLIPTFLKEFFNLSSFALKLIVSGEILANVYNSIGGNIHQASIYSDTILLMALTIFVCLIGIVFEIIGKVLHDKSEAKYL